MQVPADHQLLQAYTRDGSHDAFARIVHRHVDLVYSAALRLTGDSHHAQDVTQTVFLRLATKAAALDPRVILPGWLLTATRYVVADLRKAQARRHRHEQRAAEIRTMTQANPQDDWRQIAPDLDDAIASLGEANRLAIVLRYFKGYSVAQAAAELGISDDAVKQRSARGLEQLREFFLGRGVTTGAAALASTTALASALSANAVHAAPAGLASVASAAVAAAIPAPLAVSATTTSAIVTVTAMSLLKSNLAVAVVLIVLAATGAAVLVMRLGTTPPPPRNVALTPTAPATTPADTMIAAAAPRPLPPPAPPAPPAGNTLIKGRVTLPDGSPLAGAEVTVAAAGGAAVSAYRPLNRGALSAVTGPDGTFEFRNQPAKSAVLVRSKNGYALTTAGQLSSAPDVVVQPWGRIEGTLRAGDKPLANQTVAIGRWGSGDLYDWSLVDHTTTSRTDANGKFTFPSVAPGDAWVTHRVVLTPGDARDSNHQHVHVLPGQTTNLQLGGQGQPVIGRVIFPELPPMPGNVIRVHGALWRHSEFNMPRPPEWDQMDAEDRRLYEHEWRSSPDGVAWKRSVCNYEFPVSSDDGAFRIPDVRPGRYTMQIRFELRDQTSQQVNFRTTADRHLIVLDEPPPAGAPAAIDVGHIPIFVQ